MVSRRQSINCGCGSQCSCNGCLNNVADCCYIIDIGEDSYIVSWVGACSWVSAPDASIEITMTIEDEQITIVADGTTYTASFPVDTDCTSLSNLEVSEDGGEGLVYVSSAGDTCLECECYCPECAETDGPGNATCCWTVYFTEDTYYVLSKSGACLWEDVGDCGVSISIGSGDIVLEYNGQSWTIHYGETAPNCCETLDFSGVGTFPKAIPGNAEGCVDNRSCYCVAITISGIEPNNGDCGCPSCSSIDGSYYTYVCSDYSSFPGVHDYISLCTQNKPFWKCGYDKLEILIVGTSATITIYDSSTSFGIHMIFKGSYDPETGTATLSLSSQTGNSAYDCDGSSATVTIAVTNVGHYNCPNFEGCPHADYVDCTDPDWDCNEGCWGDSIPNRIEVYFPSGYIRTDGGYGAWYTGSCADPTNFCADLPDDTTVILDNYGQNEQVPGTFDLPDVGGGSLTGQYLFESDWDDIAAYTYNDECLYLYVSDILESETCFISGSPSRYEKIYLQWGVFYRRDTLWFFERTKTYRAFSAGYTWSLVSTNESRIGYSITLDEPCESETKANCWPEGDASRSSYSVNSTAHKCYPSILVGSLAVECS